MKLLKIDMLNWGPYRGEHGIDMNVSGSAPVILVHGENMRGKTSLLRAIVWGLYGKLKGQDGKDLDLHRLINTAALDNEPVTEFSVNLLLEHQGVKYDLRRGGVAERLTSGSIRMSDLYVSLLPLESGIPFAEAHIDERISAMLSYEVSDFFFFDGEMLSRFEQRLKEEQNGQKGFVRGQVERALGLPFLRTLKSDLDDLKHQTDLEIQKTLKANKRAQGLIDEYARKSEELAGREKDITQIREVLDSANTQLIEIDNRLSSVDTIKERFFERRQLESETEKQRRGLAALQLEAIGFQEDRWWFPLGQKLACEHQEIVQQAASVAATLETRIALQQKMRALEARLRREPCPSCGQDMPVPDTEVLRGQIAEVETSLAELPETASTSALAARARNLSSYASGPSVIDKISEYSREMGRTRLAISQAEQRIKAIAEDLAGNDVDIAALESQRQSVRQRIEKAEETLKAAERRVDSVRAERSQLSAKIGNHQMVPKQDRRRLDALEHASTVVRDSFDSFSQSMRERVQDEATRIFKSLTTEPLYSGVAISDDYRLSIVGPQGTPVDMVSAGGSQILTMAFIGALADCSAEEAPMVMDTPFGRLDLRHRESILRWVSESRTQVMLFVQSGEYNDQSDRAHLGNKVGREYRINRISERESEIVSMR